MVMRGRQVAIFVLKGGRWDVSGENWGGGGEVGK